MTNPPFRLVAQSSDWGSPLAEQPAFDTLEEAAAAAQQYIVEQRRSGGMVSLGALMIEETRADGSVVSHLVA